MGPMGLLDKLLAAMGIARDGTPIRATPGDATAVHETREAEQVAVLSVLDPQAVTTTVDLMAEASRAEYENGHNKRRRYPPVDLRKRRVVAVLHQTGFTWRPSNTRHALITAHDVIRADAATVHLHPWTTRLVAANRFDRAPWHAINLEVVTNAEGVDGRGNWYRPDLFGKGRATDAQIEAAWRWVCSVQEGLDALGVELYGIAPHIVSGRDKHGRPNRTIDPGSRIWSLVGERAGAELGLRVPGPGWTLGGAPVPDSWHGPYWPRCRHFLDGSTIRMDGRVA